LEQSTDERAQTSPRSVTTTPAKPNSAGASR
jgi:hypothetical protein